MGVSFPDFMMQVRRMKRKVNSIEGLKKMWGADNLDHKIRKCIRILSYQFMRKNCLQYIFHSKVRNYGTHIKYRQKLIEGIEDPVAFNHIKDYWFFKYPLFLNKYRIISKNSGRVTIFLHLINISIVFSLHSIQLAIFSRFFFEKAYKNRGI